MVQADYLFLMTDVDCLYDSNPRTNPDAKAIEVVEDIADLVADVSSAGSAVGTGGMSTKITAARLATSAGVTTVITKSNKPGNIASIVNFCESQRLSEIPQLHSRRSFETPHNHDSPSKHVADGTNLVKTAILKGAETASGTITPRLDEPERPPLHTRFLPDLQPIRDRYFWLLYGLTAHGTIYIDTGAHRALADKAGLLPVGVVDVEGSFGQQECVRIVVVKRKAPGQSEFETSDPAPFEVGKALVNYSAAEIRRIQGVKSTEIHGILGYADSEYVAFRENIAFEKRESRPATPSRMSASQELEARIESPKTLHLR